MQDGNVVSARHLSGQSGLLFVETVNSVQSRYYRQTPPDLLKEQDAVRPYLSRGRPCPMKLTIRCRANARQCGRRDVVRRLRIRSQEEIALSLGRDVKAIDTLPAAGGNVRWIQTELMRQVQSTARLQGT